MNHNRILNLNINRFCSILLVILLSIFAINIYSQSNSYRSIIISGKVICDCTNKPIENAQINVITDYGEISRIKSNREGKFEDSLKVNTKTNKADVEIIAKNYYNKYLKIDSLIINSNQKINVRLQPMLISVECIGPVHFNKDSYITQDTALKNVAEILKNNKNLKIELSGFYAPDENNIAKERADFVKKFLRTEGINRSKIKINCRDSENRPYFELKCGMIPYYKKNEPDIMINKDFIESIGEKEREFYRSLMRTVIVILIND